MEINILVRSEFYDESLKHAARMCKFMISNEIIRALTVADRVKST